MDDSIEFLGGEILACPALRNTGWDPNLGGWVTGNGTNTSGFSGSPGGWRHPHDGGFFNFGNAGMWWSSTENTASPGRAWHRYINSGGYITCAFGRSNESISMGNSVRCVKD